jgi:hypothetical protein
MPTYVYQVINKDGSEGEVFEVEHPMSDPPLKKHPETGQPVRRVYHPPNLGIEHTKGKTDKTLSKDNLERHGFTQYKKVGKGQYEKRAGKGPDTLSSD